MAEYSAGMTAIGKKALKLGALFLAMSVIGAGAAVAVRAIRGTHHRE